CAVAVRTPTRHITRSSSWIAASRLHSSSTPSTFGCASSAREFLGHSLTPSSVLTLGRPGSPPNGENPVPTLSFHGGYALPRDMHEGPRSADPLQQGELLSLGAAQVIL